MSSLGLGAIVLLTMVVLSLVFVTSVVDRRFSLQAQELEKHQSQLQMVFDNMIEGIVVLDPRGNVLLRNAAACRLLALPAGRNDYAAVVEQFDAFSSNGNPLPPEEWPTARALRGEFVQDYEILYPDGLIGEAIPLTARILTTVDVYDALTRDRPHRSAHEPEHALRIMREEVAKGWWDGHLVKALSEIVPSTAAWMSPPI